MNLNRFSFLSDLEKEYDRNPAKCSYCGKTLTFKKFYNQFEFHNKFCSKKCKAAMNEDLQIAKTFSSETEKIIYSYLTFKYPYYVIKHNIIDVFAPYEVDMCIETENFPIFFEYNSSLHYVRTSGKLKNSTEKHQLNDVIKKNEICNNRQHKLIRLWSAIGLYSRPDTFEKALKQLKIDIDYLINANNSYGQCIDIVVNKDCSIWRENLKYKKETEKNDDIVN